MQYPGQRYDRYEVIFPRYNSKESYVIEGWA